MDVIDIGTVLNKFADTVDEDNLKVKEYGIRFITSDGRVRTMRARKGVRNETLKQQLQKPLQVRGKITYNLQRAGNMQLHDLDINEPRTVKPSMFFSFKNFRHTEFSRIQH
jgi:hypothetical protein